MINKEKDNTILDGVLLLSVQAILIYLLSSYLIGYGVPVSGAFLYGLFVNIAIFEVLIYDDSGFEISD